MHRMTVALTTDALASSRSRASRRKLAVRVQKAGLADVPDGSIYPALGRLERDGHVTSRLVASPSGPARKYYRPTDSGRALLARGTASWRALVDVVDPLLTRPVPTKPKEAAA